MTDDMITLYFLAILLGLIPAIIAKKKEHSFFVWWVFGAALFIVALPMAILLTPNIKEIERKQMQSDGMKKCTYCAELIKAEAIICRHCGNKVEIGS